MKQINLDKYQRWQYELSDIPESKEQEDMLNFIIPEIRKDFKLLDLEIYE